MEKIGVIVIKEIQLTQGKVALVDDDDYDELIKYKWFVNDKRNAVKAVVNGERIYMHRFIMQPPFNLIIDHINRNPLDNRRCNLRICTVAENNRNRTTKRNSASKYLGVSADFKRGKWFAEVIHEGKIRLKKRYNTEKEAALAYNEVASFYHGEFVNLNIL